MAFLGRRAWAEQPSWPRPTRGPCTWPPATACRIPAASCPAWAGAPAAASPPAPSVRLAAAVVLVPGMP
eukprot:1305452-Lingulodinium_polyedra.AAC.1